MKSTLSTINIKTTGWLLLMLLTGVSCSRKTGIPGMSAGLQFDSIRVVTIDRGPYMTGPCEPSISVSPINRDHIVAGAVLNNYYASQDGGKTWKKGKLNSAFGVYGDPVVRHTNSGRVLFGHLSNPANKAYASEEFLDRIVVQKSDDGGDTWKEGSFPAADLKKDHDKHWISVDPVSGAVLMAWTEFDKYGSSDAEDRSRILFSVSHDDGETWSQATTLSEKEGDCLDDDKTTEGAVPVAGTDGTYYTVWAYDSNIYLDRSSDNGVTWLAKDLVIGSQPGGWSIDIPGIGRCNGMPVIKADHSNGKYRGNLYVSWGDQRAGSDDTDIWSIHSNDGGQKWSEPVRVNNDPPGHHQFLSWMDVDVETGIIYLVFYDRRAYDSNYTDVYLAYSANGGRSFENIRISDKPFLPEPTVFFGDYNDISARNGVVRPIWTEQDGFRLSVRTALINVRK